MRLIKKFSLTNTLYQSSMTYPAPSNITYWWNFGELALICLVIQLLTGMFLAMHYVPNADHAFISVEHIMRDVNYGWLMRYVHANGASMFFLVVYMHMFRGLYYGSYTYPREALWIVGVIILLIMIGTAFMGYVLPWGQMSFWAATVITNLASAIEMFNMGEAIVQWLWGGFSVDNPTLNSFFSFHFVLPFVLVALVGLHLIFLHDNGSNNPLGINFRVDQMPLSPYFTIKDVFGTVLFAILFSFIVAFYPNVLGHSDNYIPANPLVTPSHIVPEWYFLPFYAILRSVPSKLGGVLLLLGAMVMLVMLPFIVRSETRSSNFRPFYQILFWLFFMNCLFLGWMGGKTVETPFYEIGQFSTLFYFAYFIILLPLCVKIEKFLWKSY